MKPFSLRFIKEGLELKFQQHKMQSHKGVFKRNLIFYAIMSLWFNIYFFSLGQYIIGVICTLYCLFIIPLVYVTMLKYPKYFDLICFVYQIGICLAYPIFNVLNYNYSPLEDIESFLTGQSVTFIVISFNLGSRFDLKFLTIFINFFVQFTIIIYRKKYTSLTVVWVVSNFMIINYVYWHDRIEKEAFLIKQNEKLWQKQIGSCAKICIMNCVVQLGLIQLDFNECNEISQKEFCITDSDTFKQFLNRVKLISKTKFNLKILNDMKSSIKSKRFNTLYNQIHLFSNNTQIDKSEFIGVYNNSIYDINIFTTWNDQLLNIHTLMTKSYTQTESETTQRLEYERKLFTQYRQEIKIQIQTMFIKLRKLKELGYQQTIHSSLLSDIHNALRLNYNIQLFLNPYYKQIKTGFLLLPLLERINTIVINGMPEPFKLAIKCAMNPGLRLFTCQKSILQIIFNMLSFITRPAQQSGLITITAKQQSNRVGVYVNFCIATNIQKTQNFIDSRNYYRSLYGENKGFYHHDRRIGLEVAVSQYLIGKIGPKRRLKFENLSQNRHTIRFSIYMDLEQSMII